MLILDSWVLTWGLWSSDTYFLRHYHDILQATIWFIFDKDSKEHWCLFDDNDSEINFMNL